MLYVVYVYIVYFFLSTLKVNKDDHSEIWQRVNSEQCK